MAVTFTDSAEYLTGLPLGPERKFIFPKLALVLVQGQPRLFQSAEYFVQSLIVLLLVLPVDKDVIYHADHSLETSEDLRHPPLKVLGCKGNPKWQAMEILPTKRGNEGGESAD